MIYMQITTRCQMHCQHCCYSCTAKGQDMSMDIVKAALKTGLKNCEQVFIGGGEPTLHPQFEEIMLRTIAMTQSMIPHGLVGVITNGGITKRALWIVKLIELHMVRGFLSQDSYHDPISPTVVQAFKKIGAIHNTTSNGRKPMPHGRGRKLRSDIQDGNVSLSCPCDAWFVKPNGHVYQCGCENAIRLGTVHRFYTGYNSDVCSQWV